MALCICLGTGIEFILLFSLPLVLLPDNCEVQLVKTRKLKSTRISSSSEKSALKGFVVFGHFNLHLHLHNTWIWFITMNTNLVVGREMVWGL